jgi:phage/plasmid-associated DNA primase
MTAQLPVTPECFIQRNGDGTLDLHAIRALLPDNDTTAAKVIARICHEAGQPVLHGTQSGTWRIWDGSVYSSCHKLGTRLADAFAEAHAEVLALVRGQIEDRAIIADRDAREGQPSPAAAERAGTAARQQAMAVFDGQKAQGGQWAAHKDYSRKIRAHGNKRALGLELEDQCATNEELFDRHPGLIAAEGQVIDGAATAASGYVVVRPADPGLMLTKRIRPGLAYDPAACCPVIMSALAASVPDDDQRGHLLLRLAYALAGLQPRKGWVNMIGPTNSGKSTFLALVQRLAGDYGGTVPVETFLAGHGDRGFLWHELRGLRVIVTSEPPEGRRMNDSLIKSITGRDKQHTAGKNQPYVGWWPESTIFMAANAPLGYNTADLPLLERQELIGFALGYEVPDRRLLDRMTAELPGFLSMLMNLLAASAAAYAGGWDPEILPVSMTALREDMADQTETSLRFLSEMVNEGHLAENKALVQEQWASTSQLYLLYQSWCEAEGIRHPDGRKTFSSKIGRRYPIVRTTGPRRFSGLILPNANPLIDR